MSLRWEELGVHMISNDDVTDFLSLFKSNETAYGVTLVGNIVNGKAEARSSLVHESVSAAVVNTHLNGQKSIGLSPFRSDGTIYWGAIDIDDYTGNVYDIVEAIRDFNLPLVPCLSKSKKLHVYCFFSEAVDAADGRELLSRWAGLFRCSDKVEIFPKQSKALASYKFFSWINLPYFDANNPDNWRKAVTAKNEYLDIHQFIDLAKSRRMSLKEHLAFLDEMPYHDAPPCILSGVLLRDIAPGQRNQWFYNVACYLRMTDESIDLDEPLLELNESIHTPLPEREILTTVAKVRSKSCYYQCSGMYGCNKNLCRKADKGIGNDKDSAGISFGQLTQVMTDPPYWTWEINSVEMRFNSTEDIMNQNIFRKQCIEKLHHTPNRVKDERWTKILNRALENVVVQQVDVNTGFGKGTVFRNAALSYLTDKAMHTDKIVLTHIGKVYTDGKYYVFLAMQFRKYLREVCRVYDIPDNEILQRLQDMGAEAKGGYWYLPVTALVPEVTDEQITASIDYGTPEAMDKTEEERVYEF